MCRAHGIAHQRVTERGALQGALRAAWRLNTHSVVEVVTQPGAANVAHHRRIQDAVRRAVLRALQPVSPPTGSPWLMCELRGVLSVTQQLIQVHVLCGCLLLSHGGRT